MFTLQWKRYPLSHSNSVTFVCHISESMKFTITTKVFATLLGIVGILSISLFFLLQWSFGKGFIEYVNRIEGQRLIKLQYLIEDYYSEKQSFAEFTYVAGLWPDLIYKSARQADKNLQMTGEQSNLLPVQNRFEQRVALYTKDKKLIVGPSFVVFNQFIPVIYKNEAVAYIGYNPRQDLSTTRDIAFAEEINRNFFTIFVISLVISSFLAVPLARRLVSPVKRIRNASRQLAGGDYSISFNSHRSDEIGELERDIEQLAQTLEDNMRSRQRWIADISHELRTPVTIIRGQLEAMLDGIRPVDLQQLASIRDETIHIQDLISDLHDLSVADSGAMTYVKQNIDLRTVILSVLNQMEGKFQEKSLTVNVEIETASPLMVYADEKRMRQLIVNILTNSVNYTEGPGQIAVKAEAKEGVVELVIQDSPQGVTDEQLAHLFDRFYRVEQSRNRDSGGSGLGLSICKQIVEAHGGTIIAFHADMGGVGIKIVLPEKRHA